MSYDAVIVLANEMDRFGVLNQESVARANLAANIVNDLKVPYLVTCGWAYRSDSEIKIADAFKNYLVKVGVATERIITEINSRDTVGDAVFTRINLEGKIPLGRLCVVTSSYHVPRVQKIFEFIYGERAIDVRGVEVDFDNERLNKELASIRAFEDTFSGVKFGDLPSIIDALSTKHPFYNGEVYEKLDLKSVSR